MGSFLAIIGEGAISFINSFNVDFRWWVVLCVLIVGSCMFLFVRDKDIFLLRITVLLLPFGIGVMFSPMLEADLFWAFDATLFILILWWFKDKRILQIGKIYIHNSTIPALLMLFWTGLGVFVAISRLGTVHALFYLFKAALFYFYIINNVTTKRKLKAIVNMLIIGLAFQSAIGLAQKVLGRSLGLGFLGEVQGRFWFELARVRGTLGFPNQFGAYLIMIIPLVASLFIFSRKTLIRLLYAVVVIISLLSLFYTMSRSSWFGMIVAVIVMFIILMTRRRLDGRVIGSLIVVAVVIAFIAYSFWDVINLRFSTGGTGENRMLMIRIAIPIILSHPILGVGLSNYAYYSYSKFEFWKPVHNEYLRLAAEIGIPGLIFFLIFIFFIYREAFRNIKLKDPYLKSVSLGIIGGHTAILCAIFFGPMLQHYRQIFLFWLLAGLAVALKRIAKNEWALRQRSVRREKKIKEDSTQVSVEIN
jgi:O-antigen ligase